MAKEKILVVDDEENIRERMKEFLIGEGYEVDLAENGDKALKMFDGNGYDIVFMDIKMPGIDGIETLRKMKKAKPKIKVIIISGLPDEEAFEGAMTVSEEIVHGFIPKPFKPADLRRVLEEVKNGNVLPSFGLTEVQQKVLLETSRAGAQDASQAFSQIIKKEIKVATQKVDVSPLSYGIEAAKDVETMVVGAFLKCTGQIGGWILILFPWESGLRLVDILEEMEIGTTKLFDAKAHGTLEIAANVLATSHLNAIGRHLNLLASASFCRLSFDSAGTVLEGLGREFAGQAEHMFNIKTKLSVVDTNIVGTILLLPDVESLKTIFRKAAAFGS